MGLIKLSNMPAGAVVRFALPDLEEQARSELARARAEAERIIADAHARAAEIESAAREQGKADGWQQGHLDGRDSGATQALDEYAKRLGEVAATFTAAAAALQEHRDQVEAVATRDAVELALAIAERITRQQGAVNPAVLLENVRAAVNLAGGRSSTTRIAVHPSQRAALLEFLPQLQVDAPTLRGAEIVDDQSILPGGCRVFTSNGQIDADLKTQLDRVAMKLLPGGRSGAAHGAEEPT